MVFPVIQNYTIFVEDDEDDMKYILQASFDGRLKSDEGNLSAAGDLATLTAASGKDLYLTAAKVNFYFLSGSAVEDCIIELKVNGSTVETVHSALFSNGNTSFEYEFKNLAQKVAATQILKLEVISIDAANEVEGVIQAIEVPTGENPTTYIGA